MYKKCNMNEYFKNCKEKISFFLNAYNFLVLFALCQKKLKIIPNTYTCWMSFLASISIQIGDFKLSAFEIEHGIIRNALSRPLIHEPIPFRAFRYSPDSQRGFLANLVKEKLLNFAFFSPTQYIYIYIY